MHVVALQCWHKQFMFQTNQLLKLVTPTVGEVLNLCWTDFGLAICYKNTNVCLQSIHTFCNLINSN